MQNDEAELAQKHETTLSRRAFGSGRLGTYTVLGGAMGVVPLPWIPDAVAKRIRGALVHDLSARHGLSLTPEARAILASPSGDAGARGILNQGVKFAIGKVLGRFGPLAVIPPIRSALGTWVLGHLLQRYLETARTQRSARIDVEEARRVRRAIDQALIYALTTEGHASREDPPIPPEDLRDHTSQVIDGVLISITSLPGWLQRRLEAAFDEVLSTVRT